MNSLTDLREVVDVVIGVDTHVGSHSAAAVIVAGTLTAWLAGRAAAGRDAVLAVKEDW